MRAMVMAAGLGTRLRPLTYEVSKPMAPVANRPIMEHVLLLLGEHGLTQVIANLHWFPDPIRDRFGDGSRLGIDLSYSLEDDLLNTAGGVWNVRDFLTGGEEDSFLVLAADALSDVDLTALRAAHEANDGVATLAVKRVPNVSEYGVVIADGDGRIQGFQEKPDPAEALSDLASCMIYVFRREIFDYFPEEPHVDWANDIFPALLDQDVPFHIHAIEGYWNDVGSIREYLQGNMDAVQGAVRVQAAGELVEGDGHVGDPFPGDAELSGRILLGAGCEVGAGARLDGPMVIGDGSRIGAGARLRESVLLPGTEVPEEALLMGATMGRAGRLG
jgi:mannose-1-phosphate guanylyltransferase/mannose-1-phosphate guanylyltransferase/phosphomannomutase